MNKKITGLVLALALILSTFSLVLAGCSSNGSSGETTAPATTAAPATTQPEKTVSVETLVGNVQAVAEMNKVSAMDNTIASEMYNNLDLSLLDEYSFNMPLINVKCDEITIVKVKDAKDVEMVKKAMEYRYENIVNTWKQYLPDQYEIVQKGQIVTNGKYLMLLIAPEVEKGVQAFNEALK